MVCHGISHKITIRGPSLAVKPAAWSGPGLFGQRGFVFSSAPCLRSIRSPRARGGGFPDDVLHSYVPLHLLWLVMPHGSCASLGWFVNIVNEATAAKGLEASATAA